MKLKRKVKKNLGSTTSAGYYATDTKSKTCLRWYSQEVLLSVLKSSSNRMERRSKTVTSANEPEDSF